MTSARSHSAIELTADQLLRQGAEIELRLLRDEQKAERRLREALATAAKHEARLRKAEVRLARSHNVVAEAIASLRESQSRRAEGQLSSG
jgi:hypothetical protein